MEIQNKFDKRITIRLNTKEQAELDLFKARFNLEKDSEAMKCALIWVNHYLKNVTETFFPDGYDVALIRKRKTKPLSRQVF